MKLIGNKTSLLIAQVEPPQKMDGGDYFYRTHAPGIAMSEEEGVYVVNLTNQHRKKAEIMSRADILILKNVCDPDILPLIRDRRNNGKLTVYEIADNLGALQPWNSVYCFYKNKENLALVNRLAGCCDALQTTCQELKRIYGHLNDNCKVFSNNISHIPHERPMRKGTEVIIGWGGSHGHLEDIAEIANSLIKWINTNQNVYLHLMCSDPIWKLFDSLSEHKKKRTLPGTVDDYYNFLRGIDIGIAPLNDTDFNRSRSDVKFLEYAVSEVVPIMARLEPYTSSVENEKTGFLFEDTKQLITILSRLLKNTSILQEITKAARQYVIQKRLQLQHVRDRLDFYGERLKQLRTYGFKDENVTEYFEEWSQLKGAVRKGRHIQFQATRFEDLLHDGLVALQTADNKKLAHQFFKEAAALEPKNYLPLLFGASVSLDPISSLNRALELKPDSLKAWTLLGEEFAKRGNIREAFKSFDSAARIYLDYEVPYLRVATLLKKIGERSQSEWFFEKAKEVSIPYAFA